jgi:hypothetical protein
LSLRQNLCGVGITLNGAHGSPSKELASENASTSACEKSQLIHRSSWLVGSRIWTCSGRGLGGDEFEMDGLARRDKQDEFGRP